jgi:hypothetical protein
MLNLDSVEKVFSIVGNMFIFFGVFVVVWQLLADHKRRKYQATLEFYRKIGDKCDDLLEIINDKFPDGDVIEYDKVKNDREVLKAIEKFLFLMEEISVGINTKAFDIKVFGKITGEDYIKWFYRFERIIENFRVKYNPCVYKDFEKMIYKLNRIRQK